MRRIALLVFLLSCSVPVRGQRLIPGGFAGWTPAEGVRVSGVQLERLLPGDGLLLKEYGAETAERQTFKKDGGALTVTVIQFRDPTGSFGAFLHVSSPDASPLDLSEMAVISRERAVFTISNLLVEVEGSGLRERIEDLKALASVVRPRARREAGPYPSLGRYFPGGALKGSRKFALGPVGLERIVPTGKGDWLGFDLGAEVEAARYKLGDRESTLLLVSYPTPQVAIAREKALARWFNLNLAEEKVEGRPVLFTRRMTTLLAILAGADAQKQGEALLAKVHYETEVTLNEPSYKATDPPLGLMLYRVFSGTFYFVGFGIVIGIAFAIFRLGIKRLLPGKIFDRPGAVEIIQLGLGSKPIEGKDFYQ